METLLLADSFRVRVHEGIAEARGIELHVDRFVRGVRALAGPDPSGFLHHALAEVAAYGAGFPRLELRETDSGPVLAHALRPLPELRSVLSMRSAPRGDQRHPELKGPAIARYTELSHRLGAEALLVGADGSAIEGATTSVLWWDGHVLCSAASRARVESVTERLVLGIAAAQGTVEVRTGIAPDRLRAHEVWAVNALHGIRVVDRIDDAPTRDPDLDRLAHFRAALDRSWRPVEPSGAGRYRSGW